MHLKGKRGYCTIPMLTMHCGHLKVSYSHPSLANLARLKRPLIIRKSSSASRASQAHLRYANPWCPYFRLRINTSACEPCNLSELIYFSKGLVFHSMAIKNITRPHLHYIHFTPFELRAKKKYNYC